MDQAAPTHTNSPEKRHGVERFDPAPPVGTKRALLIGINEYKAPSVPTLGGSVNDVELMKATLIGKFDFLPENVLVLRDAEATRNQILKTIREHLIGPARPNDIVLLHFSGHGSQMIDVSGDELDGLDETIVPYDSRQGDVFDISDDEINGLLSELTRKTPNVVLILDSCHSGSASRAALTGNTVRQIPPDTRQPPKPESFARSERGIVEQPGSFLENSNYVLISGSDANELSNESSFAGKRHGALTYFLVQAMLNAPADTTYRDLMDEVKVEVSLRFTSQHPQLEGAGAENVVFGSQRLDTRAYLLVEPAGGRQVVVSAGEIFGLRPDTRLRVFPPGTKSFKSDASVAEVKLTDVQIYESHGEIQGAGRVVPHSRAILQEIRPPDSWLGIYLDTTVPPNLAQSLKAELRDYESVRFVQKSDAADLRVYQASGQVNIEGRDLDLLHSFPVDKPNVGDDILQRIVHWSRWFALLHLANPSPSVSVDLRLIRPGATASDLQTQHVTEGTEVTVAVTSRSNEDLYVVLLDLAPDGSVSVLYPKANIPDSLPPGKTLQIKVGTSVPPGRRRSADVVKVIATTKPIPSGVFRLGPVPRSAAPAARGDESPLEKFLRLSTQGLTRNLSSVDVEGWVTTQRILAVEPATTRLASLAVHVAAPDASRVLRTLSQSRAVCGAPTVSGCYEIGPAIEGLNVIQLQVPRTRGGADLVRSTGQVFEQAYKLRDETGALRVEPLFDDEPMERRDAPSGQRRDLPPVSDVAAAGADTLWSLRHIRAMEAWTKLRNKSGRAEGSEAEGILIAHPDTGYLPHPEIWAGSPGHRPVWPEKGYNYYEKTDDPTDPLLDQHLLDNPAHGTGSGSAIVSPKGCQLAGANQCPTGVALGAQLIPLRVNRSVVQLSTFRLVEAIVDAAGDDRTRIKAKTQLMSLSMGGFPSWFLWKAVKRAEEQGYLIIAASGNYVKTVVWPARFSSVIGVAATNVNCQPWAYTSLGPAVSISAPGESVWRATINDRQEFVTGMGTGTTYATATTAGAAALWMAYHSGNPDFENLKKRGELTRVFRKLLQESSWRPDGDVSKIPRGVTCKSGIHWSPTLLGPGIVDAAALLEKQLPASGTTRSVGPATLQQLPLWGSLYPIDKELAVIEADYRSLFLLGPSADLEPVAVFEAEVTHHYATSDGVQEALDAIVQKNERTSAAFLRARVALSHEDLSSQLRTALKKE